MVLYMGDQRGVIFDSLKGAPPAVTIEDSGPLRASACVRGFHASGDGRRFCPYVLRMHFYAGKADMRVFHTFVFDQDPERIELSEVGVSLPLDLGDGLRMAFGGQERSHWAKRFEEGRILQASDIEYRVARDEEPFGSGAKTRGWGSLSGDAGSAVAVIRDMWQEYPKGIRIDKDGIDVQIWPMECGRTLKFSTPWKEWPAYFSGAYGDPPALASSRDEAAFRQILKNHPTAGLNLKSTAASTPDQLLWVEEMVARYAPDRPASHNDTGTDNGFGAAKTTEFHLRFSADAMPDESAEALGICVQELAIAPPDPSYACATGAMRLMAPYDPKRFPEDEKRLDDLFEQIVAEPRRVLRNYGMIDYGDLMCSHSAAPAAMWFNFKNEPDIIERMKHCARSYNNEANDQVNAVWGFFAHTGQRKYFLAAEAYGEHMADVDIAHVYPDGSPGGLMHYHNCHHWTGFGSPSHTCIAGLMLQYYLTGNRRIHDVCREAADWVLSRQEPWGILGNRGGTLVREFTTPVANLLEVYQATWEQKYGDLARRSLKWFLLAMPEPGCFPVSIYTAGERGDEAEVEQVGWHLAQAGGMTPQFFYDGVRLFGKHDPVFKDALLGMVQHFVWGASPDCGTVLLGPDRMERPDPYFNATLIAYAYELTGDPVYAAYCRSYLRDGFPQRIPEKLFTFVCWGSIIPPMMEAVRRAEARHGAAELDRAERDLFDKLAATTAAGAEPPRPRGIPPRRSLGVIAGYDR